MGCLMCADLSLKLICTKKMSLMSSCLALALGKYLLQLTQECCYLLIPSRAGLSHATEDISSDTHCQPFSMWKDEFGGFRNQRKETVCFHLVGVGVVVTGFMGLPLQFRIGVGIAIRMTVMVGLVSLPLQFRMAIVAGLMGLPFHLRVAIVTAFVSFPLHLRAGVRIAVMTSLVSFPLHLRARVGIAVVAGFVSLPFLLHFGSRVAFWIGIAFLLPLLFHFRTGIMGCLKFHLGCPCAIL